MRKNLFFCFLLLFTIIIAAQEEQSDVNKAADDVTNPLAFVTKLQIQPNYTLKEN